jgi:hypothetical protein
LQFLIQGDFIVNASRGEILENNLWNSALRDAIRDATKTAAQSLKLLDGPVKYQWLRWLPAKLSTVDFFREFPQKLLRDLGRAPILESSNGSWRAPSDLIYVPPEFCDSERKPFTFTQAKSVNYLSKEYSDKDKEILLSLGVTEMSLDQFLADLKVMAEWDPKGFQARSLKWHSDLAGALQAAMNKHTNSDTRHKKELSRIALVPLRNGKWLSGIDIKGKNNLVFFPSHSLGCELPTGLTYDVVDADAVSFRNRKWLFEYLGVGEIDNRSLAQFIIKFHGNERINPALLSLDNILSQLLFLYNSRWTRPEDSHPVLWMVSENEQRYVGIDLYLDSHESLSATQIFTGHRHKFPFLHPRIVNGNPANAQDWHKWLLDQAGVSRIPRLFRKFECHTDFEFISDNFGTNMVLQVLKTHWVHYRRDIELDYTLEHGHESNESRKELVKTISRMMVRCTDRVERPLHQTFLPMQVIIKDAEEFLPYLDIPDLKDKRWVYILSFFRVGCEDDLQFCLKCLECVKRVTGDRNVNPSYQFLSRLYELIQVRANDDEELVR